MQTSTNSLAMTKQLGHAFRNTFPEKTQTQITTLKERTIKQFDNRNFQKS